MNDTHDMLAYLQIQMLAKLQSGGKPAAPKPGDRESFQDLLSQKGKESTEKPQAPTAEKPQTPAEQPETPAEPPQEGDALDPYRQQLLAAAQAAAMAVPVLTAEAVPTDQTPQAQPVAPIQAAPQGQEQMVANLPKLEQQGMVGDAPAVVTTPEQQALVDAPAQASQTAVPQEKSAPLMQAPKAESAPSVPQQPQAAVTAAPVAAVQTTTETETGADTAQPELQKGREPGKEPVVTSAQTAPEQTLFRQMESAPIKVGDAPVVDTQSPDMEAQLAKQVDTLLAKGGDRVELQLNPVNLGSVTLTLTRSQDGSLHVSLSAGNEKALSLLEKHASGLESALLGTNRAPVQVEVQRSQDSQQSQHQQETYDREGHGQREQQQRQNQRESSQDFLQQLRLGLFSTEEAAS